MKLLVVMKLFIVIKHQFRLIAKLLVIGGLFVVASANTFAQTDKKVFYRYTTSEGRKVVSQTIPPQYIRNGYELLTIGGEVLKVVPPAPPEADAERIAKERKAAKEQAKVDLDLRRKYSSVKDIESAKTRNLQELQNTISILEANISNVKKQLQVQEQHAASIERGGKTVSEEVLKNITTLRNEERDLNVQLKQRQAEYDSAAATYDKDKARFIEITGQQ